MIVTAKTVDKHPTSGKPRDRWFHMEEDPPEGFLTACQNAGYTPNLPWVSHDLLVHVLPFMRQYKGDIRCGSGVLSVENGVVTGPGLATMEVRVLPLYEL